MITVRHDHQRTVRQVTTDLAITDLAAVALSGYAMTPFVVTTATLTWRRTTAVGGQWTLTEVECVGRRQLASGKRGKARAERRYGGNRDSSLPDWVRTLGVVYAPEEEGNCG